MQCLWQIFERYLVNSQFQLQPPIRWITFFYYKRTTAATHSLKLTVFLQNKNCSKEISVINDISLVSGIYIYWKKSVILKHQLQQSSYHIYGSVMTSWEHLKRSISQGRCVYFTTPVATIYYNKRPVVDSKKFEGYVYSRKAIVILLFWRCLLIPQTYFQYHLFEKYEKRCF